jgi:hypothetical protein
MLHRAIARICLDLDIEEGQDPSGVLVEQLSDFLRRNSLVDLFKIKPVPEPAESTDTDEHGYEDALSHLEGLGDLREDGIFNDDDQLALDKGKQALRDCLEMGLNGIGD